MIVTALNAQPRPLHDLHFVAALQGFTWPPSNIKDVFKNSEHTFSLSTRDHRCELSSSAISSPHIREVLRAMIVNMDRVLAGLNLPRFIFEHALRIEHIARMAFEHADNANDPLFENESDLTRRHRLAKAKFAELRTRIYDPPAVSAGWDRFFGQPKDEIPLLGTASHGGNVWVGLEAILHTALLGLWTAFESCATDLWVTALNVRPATLGRNVVLLRTTAKKNSDSQETHVSNQQERRIRFKDLAAYDFNISGEMGRFLKQHDHARFDSLVGIQAAYFDAFRTPDDKNHRTSQPLNDLFEQYFDDLKVLEAIRNLLAHRGGIVDERFVASVVGHSDELSRLPLREPISVTGHLVAHHIRSATLFAVKLMDFVADWLARRTE